LLQGKQPTANIFLAFVLLFLARLAAENRHGGLYVLLLFLLFKKI